MVLELDIDYMEEFIGYIKLRLGYPVVNVELTNTQFEMIIKDVLINRYNIIPVDFDNVLLDYKDECVMRAYDLWEKILNKYPGVRQLIETTNDKESCAAFVLSKEHPNIFFISCGHMPRSKADEHVKQVMTEIRKIAGPEYKIVCFPKFKSC